LKPILRFGTLLTLAGCSGISTPPKPDLPLSISPGWSTKGYESSAPPEGLPRGEIPVCWKADYTGPAGAVAETWVCGYAHGAFDAMQRAPAAANTVKFYKGRYLVMVRWSNSSGGLSFLE